MRQGRRRIISLAAIYAVALHTAFFGFMPIGVAQAAATDPFSVICHGVAPDDGAPGQSDHLVPAHACEHCNLCSATAPPTAPDVALIGNMAPVRVLHILRLASALARCGITSNPEQARGPPAVV